MPDAPRVTPGKETSATGAVAAIDCGTNSTRMLVVDDAGATLARPMQITRLGQGVDATGRIEEAAIVRTVTALKEMRGVIDHFGVRRIRVVATSACRDADNREEFLRAASEATGAHPEILTGEEEGRLAYAGAISDLDEAAGSPIVLDIGGGSTELILEADDALRVASLPLGCVRLTERYFLHDPPLADELARARDVVEATVAEALSRLLPVSRHSRLVGLAGTVTTLAALDQRLEHYDRSRTHHFVLTTNMVWKWLEVLSSQPAAERAKHPGMTIGREDVIVGGLVVLEVVMRLLDAATCLISESDILDGMVAEMLGGGRSSSSN